MTQGADLAEGRVAWSGHETWYIADIAQSGRPCIFYDQIGGNGRSSQRLSEGQSKWTVDLFLEELDP